MTDTVQCGCVQERDEVDAVLRSRSLTWVSTPRTPSSKDSRSMTWHRWQDE